MNANEKIGRYKKLRSMIKAIDRQLRQSIKPEESDILIQRRESLIDEIQPYSTIVIAKYNDRNKSMFTYIPADSDISPGDILAVHRIAEEDNNNDRPKTTKQITER